jgi:hypothetical protein
MKTALAIVAVALVFQAASMGQGTFSFGRSRGPGGSSYITGSGSFGETGPAGATDLRRQTFGGSGYFNSSGEVIDPGLALRMGDGVNPLAASSAGVVAVPEPSGWTLAMLGMALLFAPQRRVVRP